MCLLVFCSKSRHKPIFNALTLAENASRFVLRFDDCKSAVNFQPQLQFNKYGVKDVKDELNMRMRNFVIKVFGD